MQITTPTTTTPTPTIVRTNGIIGFLKLINHSPHLFPQTIVPPNTIHYYYASPSPSPSLPSSPLLAHILSPYLFLSLSHPPDPPFQGS